ncbi:glycosyl hydrolase family 38 protein [Cooperia oncophora]
MPKPDPEEFKKKHYAHFEEMMAKKRTLFFDLYPPEEFEKYIRLLGVNNNDHLYGHDKVSVLDGGLDAWKKAGQPVTGGDVVVVKPGNWKAKPINPALLITFEELNKKNADGKSLLEELDKVVNGPIIKKVYVVGPKDVPRTSTKNYELAMRMDTNIQSGSDLYTDLNGLQYALDIRVQLQIIRRRRQLDKLPLQAHFYPMPSAAYIEDTSTRLSLHGNQPLGVSSLKPGQIEVMLDRRLNQDDDRGLFQDVTDNHRTLSRFRLLVEPLEPSDNKNSVQERLGFHSMVGLAQSAELHYPPIRMISSGKIFC